MLEADKYEVLCRLAEGGMAQLFLVRVRGIEGFEKIVVLKRILPEHAGNRVFVDMFLDEARLAARLQHPNVAQVYEIGRSDGDYFFTMEYIHGHDLREILAEGRKRSPEGYAVALPEAVGIVIHAAAGLHYAHEMSDPAGKRLGIVHRDVSPSNILCTFDGAVKLVDFGIAKATTAGAETRATGLKGKVAYMSPEQCRGKPLDRRSDVFALGVVLYELTTGRRPFSGATEFEVMEHLVSHDPPLPSAIRADMPRELEQIIERALRRDPAERYESAQALQVALQGFAREHKLDTSSVGLQAYMQALFGEQAAAYRLTVAEGRSLAAHRVETVTRELGPTGHRTEDAPMAPARSPRRLVAVLAVGLAVSTTAIVVRGCRQAPVTSPSTAGLASPDLLRPTATVPVVASEPVRPPPPAEVAPRNHGARAASHVASRSASHAGSHSGSTKPALQGPHAAATHAPDAWDLDSHRLPPAESSGPLPSGSATKTKK